MRASQRGRPYDLDLSRWYLRRIHLRFAMKASFGNTSGNSVGSTARTLLIVEARSAGGRIEQLPALMSELVRSSPDIIVTYGTPAAVAAKNATSTIPIVVATMGDPI